MPSATTFRLVSIVGVATTGLWLASNSLGLGERTQATTPIQATQEIRTTPRLAPAPELQLTWDDATRSNARRSLLLIEGVPTRFVIGVSNAGTAKAEGIVLQAFTPLGPLGPPTYVGRLAPSTSTEVDLTLVPAAGMRELCLVLSQRSGLEAPSDPNFENQRLCRRLNVENDFDSPKEIP